MIERTLVLIKPDGVSRALVGRIIQRFEDVGLKLIAMKMKWADRDFAKKHYKAHIGKPFYQPLEDFLTSGPVVAMVLEGPHAVEIIRKMVGGTEPRSSAPGTIRGDFALHSYQFADAKKISIMNLIHASGTSDEAKIEINVWFAPEELHSYKVTHEVFTH